MNRKGFAYIVAVLILGLLAFMGLFLMQSSGAEYSQAAISCYATMAQQLAEAAADEAFILLEDQFRDGTNAGKKGPLLRQASTSDYPPAGSTGLNPKLLDILPDFRSYVTQTNWLISNHISRAGFEIESVVPQITDCRPIDHRPFTLPQCVYQPKDRREPFDTKLSRGYYLSLTFNVTIALRVGPQKHKFLLSTTRDMKVVNVGPVGRNYTLFSCLGVEFSSGNAAQSDQEIRNDMSLGKGRLVLWNHPFQSRVYIHGPAIIGVENPDMNTQADLDGQYLGAFLTSSTDGKPGPSNQAFQYSDTYAGLSYLPYPARAFWEPPDLTWWNNQDNHKHDMAEMTQAEKDKYRADTYIKGKLPRLSNLAWSEMQDWLQLGEDYVRGTVRRQAFLPAGPFCRFPWRFVDDRPASSFAPNQKPSEWPTTTSDLKLEHRWVDGDDSFDKATKLYSSLREFKVFKMGTLQATYKEGGYPKLLNPEFALTYGNPQDPTGLFSAIWSGLKAAAGLCWGTISTPAKLVFTAGEAIFRKFFKATDPSSPQAINDQDIRNFFPTNFKDFPKAAILKMKDQDDIPRDKDGIWVLDGIYWLESFQVRQDVVYRGKGMIFVGDYNPDKPFLIAGSICAKRTTDGKRSDDNLTLIYYPFVIRQLPSGGTTSTPAPLDQCQMKIEGKGHIIEASVFSLAGIRTDTGILTAEDYATLNMDPIDTTSTWAKKGINFQDLRQKINTINGNYVNYFMKKSKLDGDLWVFHDINNPFYCTQDTQQIKEVYNETDEIMAHTVHMSPRVQHMCFSGASQ
ncbi:MAG: hypothetical protein HQM09_05350 [Candidatus Riflebacteria bacterium]|nr:hypothetical protein [Candidatus Riflebacteria bacterium]